VRSERVQGDSRSQRYNRPPVVEVSTVPDVALWSGREAYLLEELTGDTQHHTTEMLSLAASEQSPERSVAPNVTGSANAVGNNAGLEFDLIIVSVVASQCCQRRYSLIVAVTSH
jgi:hypothetical protein